MQTLSIRLSIVSIALAAAALPAFASHPTEVDSRPIARVSELSRAAVDAEARAWTRSPSPSGYVESSRQPAVQVGAKSRAEVVADTMNWVRSGLSTVEYGQVGADIASPVYRQAAQAYVALRDNSDATAHALGASGVLAR